MFSAFYAKERKEREGRFETESRDQWQEAMASASARKILFAGGTRQLWFNRQLPQTFLRQQERRTTRSTLCGTSTSFTTLCVNDDKKATVTPVIYHGSMSSALRGVKLLSASSFLISVVGAPVLTFFTNPDLSLLMKGALSTTMIVLSASTTFALHWIASPYVHKLVWIPGSDVIEVQVLSWMAITRKRKIKLSDIETPVTQLPLATFAAKNKIYYVDKDSFPCQELLDLLVPEKGEDQVVQYYDSEEE
ncbi:hypothetical protein R1flu_017048 [Riccia fluitans]|uniref:Uncharacterized protein n=1 Tax=Riccia fluitans TaxID=41844 RepID=A0ABD1YSI3_9MARC